MATIKGTVRLFREDGTEVSGGGYASQEVDVEVSEIGIVSREVAFGPAGADWGTIGYYEVELPDGSKYQYWISGPGGGDIIVKATA